MLVQALIAMLLASTAFCSPLVKRNIIGSKDIVTIDPSTTTCDSAPAADECRTAAQAAPYIAASFVTFHIDDFNTQAALVAVMLYETGGFKYSRNHFPGTPGQGTRNMQSSAYNARYAQFMSTVSNSGITPTQYQAAKAGGPAAVLALVNSDLLGFASAAWFLTTQCSSSIREELSQGTQAGWSAYLSQCIGTAATNDRTQIWDKLMAQGQWSS